MEYWQYTPCSGIARVGVGLVSIVDGQGSDVGPSGSAVSADML